MKRENFRCEAFLNGEARIWEGLGLAQSSEGWMANQGRVSWTGRGVETNY